MGYASAMSVMLLLVAFTDDCSDLFGTPWRWAHDVVLSKRPAPWSPTAATALVRRKPPAAVRRRRFPLWPGDYSPLIVAAIAFLAPFVFITLTALMTQQPGAVLPHPG